MRRRHEMTDAQWDQIKDLLPCKEGDPGHAASDNHWFVDAVLYVLKTSISWEDLPAWYGKSNTVWKRFDRWGAAGGRERLARALGEPDLEKVQLDSTSIKVHSVASTGRRAGEKRKPLTKDAAWDAGERTDHRTACGRGCRLKLLMTAGQCGDAPQAESLLEELKPGAVAHMIADAAHDSVAIR